VSLDPDRIRLKRAYDEPSDDDGTRVLVERLWPRGVKKEDAALDRWMKEISPSPELRKWYKQDQANWPEFVERYQAELDGHPDEVDELRSIAAESRLTLVLASKDVEHSSAAILRDVLLERGTTP
jgi:uncharacterized protein YeaO (DUF488 family)